MVDFEMAMELIKGRRSVRKYDIGRLVEKDLLETLCVAGQWAPTPSNIQSIHFIILDGTTENIDLIKDLSPGFPKEASSAIVICSDLKRAGGFSEKNRMILVSEEAAAAAENIALAATAAGLGSCFVASFNKEGVKKVLMLPGLVQPILIMALGYPDEKREVSERKRRDLGSVLHWNWWE